MWLVTTRTAEGEPVTTVRKRSLESDCSRSAVRAPSDVAAGASRAAGTMRSTVTSPTAAVPPCSKAKTPRATVNAHSAPEAPAKLSWARRRSGLRAVATKAAAAARTRPGVPDSRTAAP